MDLKLTNSSTLILHPGLVIEISTYHIHFKSPPTTPILMPNGGSEPQTLIIIYLSSSLQYRQLWDSILAF